MQLVGGKVVVGLKKGLQNGVALRGMFQTHAFEVLMQDLLRLANHLTRDAGLIVNALLQHGRWPIPGILPLGGGKLNDTGLWEMPPTAFGGTSKELVQLLGIKRGESRMKHLISVLVCSTLAAGVCVNGHPSVKDEYSNAAYVLTVVVATANAVPQSEDGKDLSGTDYKLRSLHVLKGYPPETFTVFSENSSGRFPMDVKKRYLVFVYREGGRLRIDNCGNSGLLDTSANALAEVLAIATK